MWEMKSINSRRGRLFAGGTYFRSRNTGQEQNSIMLEVRVDKFLITNPSDVRTSNQKLVRQMDCRLPGGDEIIIRPLVGVSRIYRNGVDGGVVDLNRIVSVPGLSIKLDVTGTTDTQFTVSVFHRVYPLTMTTATDPNTGATESGWDITALRAALQNNEWITMPARGSDPNDTEALDALVGGNIPPTRLAGADGLPVAPAGVSTGPYVELIHVAGGEDANGAEFDINQVFSWDTFNNTGWLNYS